MKKEINNSNCPPANCEQAKAQLKLAESNVKEDCSQDKESAKCKAAEEVVTKAKAAAAGIDGCTDGGNGGDGDDSAYNLAVAGAIVAASSLIF